MTAWSRNGRWAQAAVYLGLAFATVEFHGRAINWQPRTHAARVERHQAILEGTGRSPWTYRVLIPHLVELTRPFFAGVSGEHDRVDAEFERTYQFWRLVFTFLLLLAFDAFLRTWFEPPWALFGTTFVAALHPMSFVGGWYHLNLTLDFLLWTLAAIWTVRGRTAWIFPLVAVASLNRATAVFIVAIHAALTLPRDGLRRVTPRALSLLACAVIPPLVLRAVVGVQPWSEPVERIFLRNLEHPEWWLWTASFLGAFWVLPALGLRRAPAELRWLGLVMLPYLVLQVVFGRLLEARLLLPATLAAVPLGLIFLRDQLGGRAGGKRPRCATHASALLALLLVLGCTSPPPGPPNIVLITVDTLRADRVGAYGYERPTTPHIDQLASRGLLFSRAIAQAPWTLPSIASVHTGLYPSQHRALSFKTTLAEEHETLAEILRGAGYRTLGVVGHALVGRRYGFAQGFEEFDESAIVSHSRVGSAGLTHAALERLGERPTEPFFLWVHYFDPHFSYVRHPEFDFASGYTGRLPERIGFRRLIAASDSLEPEDFRYVEAVYDEEIAHTDAWIGRLLEALGDLPLHRGSVIALTADHGELFMEHGQLGHGRDLYRELVDVPLVLAGDIDRGLQGREVTVPVEVSSLGRTLLGLAGIRAPGFPGVDLIELTHSEGEAGPCLTEGSYAQGEDDRKLGVVLGDWKLIRHLESGREELFDLRSDPGEARDLSASPEAGVRVAHERLRAELDEHAARVAGTSRADAPDITLDPEERRNLRALGYID